MKVYNFEQRSEEWHKIRLGKITGTSLKDLMGNSWLSLVDKVVSEIVTGYTEEVYVNDKMQWGIDNEPLAVLEYERTNFCDTFECGFCVSDKYHFLGLSPDRWVGSNGALEIKCPSPKTHFKYIRQDKYPSEYKWQGVDYFIVNEDLEWLDFMSYDPRTECYPSWIKRFEKDYFSKDIIEAEKKLDLFWDAVESSLKKVGYENSIS